MNFVILILCIFAPAYNYAQVDSFPSTFQFLSDLLNTSNVEQTILDFAFNNDKVLPNEIRFFYFYPNGSSILITQANATGVLDTKKDLVVISHGWYDSGHTSWIISMCDEFYKSRNLSLNCVSLDWSYYSKRNYVSDSERVRKVGKVLAVFITELLPQYPKLIENLHLMGHSLGAHISGFAGKYLKHSNLLANRITGLDAAAPLFDYPIPLPDSLKLSKGDGAVVGLIHSSIGLIGYTLPRGDYDFYVNKGGPIQPECENSDPTKALFCSHFTSVEVFTQSINDPNGYLGYRCDNTKITEYGIFGVCNGYAVVPLGEWTPPDTKGVYFVTTNKTRLFQ